MQDLFGEVIYSYTRKQAVEDGQQIKLDGDLAELAREAGWKHQVFITESVWNLVQMAISNKKHMNDLMGVLWDIFFMGAHGTGRMIDNSTKDVVVIITGTGRKRNHTIRFKVGPMDIDDPTPSITIMTPLDD